MPGGCGTAQLTSVNDTIWGQDAGSGDWYAFTDGVWHGPAASPLDNSQGCAPPSSDSSGTPSSGGTDTTSPTVLTTSSGGSVTDSQGNTWSLPNDGCVQENGNAVPGGCSTAKLTSVNGTIWGQDAGSGSWYAFANGVWVGPSADPTAGAGSPPAGGDSGGNSSGNSGGSTSSTAGQLSSGSADPGNLIWESNFASGDLSDWLIQACPGGVTVVSDPLGSNNNVAKFTVADDDTDAKCPLVPTDHPRAQLVGPDGLFQPGDNVYVGFSTLFPSDFPWVTEWFEIMELYGAPWGGSPTIEIDVAGDTLTFGSHTTSTGYNTYWTAQTAFNKNEWQKIVVHVNWSTDPNQGYVELWYNGAPQTFTNGQTRVYFPTFDPSINGTSDSVFINQYREGGMGLGTVTLYTGNVEVGRTYESVAQ